MALPSVPLPLPCHVLALTFITPVDQVLCTNAVASVRRPVAGGACTQRGILCSPGPSLVCFSAVPRSRGFQRLCTNKPLLCCRAQWLGRACLGRAGTGWEGLNFGMLCVWSTLFPPFAAVFLLVFLRSYLPLWLSDLDLLVIQILLRKKMYGRPDTVWAYGHFM